MNTKHLFATPQATAATPQSTGDSRVKRLESELPTGIHFSHITPSRQNSITNDAVLRSEFTHAMECSYQSYFPHRGQITFVLNAHPAESARDCINEMIFAPASTPDAKTDRGTMTVTERYWICSKPNIRWDSRVRGLIYG